MTDTQILLDKFDNIFTCGKNNTSLEVDPSDRRIFVNEYKNCIYDLHLPLRYEIFVSAFDIGTLANKMDLRDAILRVTDTVCDELNLDFVTAPDKDRYQVFIVRQSKENIKKAPESSYKPAYMSSSTITIMSILVLMLVAIIGLSFRVYILTNKLARKSEKQSIDSKVYHEPETMNSYTATPETVYIDAAPPSYNDFGSDKVIDIKEQL